MGKLQFFRAAMVRDCNLGVAITGHVLQTEIKMDTCSNGLIRAIS